jgi:hypothetical protein
MTYRKYRLAIPSNAEYSVPQLRMMIEEVEEIIGRKITIEYIFFLSSQMKDRLRVSAQKERGEIHEKEFDND